MKYVVEKASCGVIYKASFMKIGSDVQKLLGGIQIHRSTHRQQANLISLLFFQNEESRLKTECKLEV
jgi:hypothetical protein